VVRIKLRVAEWMAGRNCGRARLARLLAALA